MQVPWGAVRDFLAEIPPLSIRENFEIAIELCRYASVVLDFFVW
jgi:hypothetical protein